MHGELINILFGFYFDIFSDLALPRTFFAVANAFYASLGTENFFQSFSTLIDFSSASSSYALCLYLFIAFVLTIITLIFLYIALIKLFKWIFNLIFKLMRLN